MPFGNFSRINLDQLYNPFLQLALETVAACNARGAHYQATCGYRSFPEQLALYLHSHATKAGPGESAHNFGLAVDFVALNAAGAADWRPEAYAVLGEEAERAGLVWGGDWETFKDCPHLQWPGFVTKEQLAPLKSVYLLHSDAPLSAVFQHLDSLKPPELS